MRILGFEKRWPKLSQPTFTTFRFPRRDRDWQVGELVQVVFKPRSPLRNVLGVARIVGKEERNVHPCFRYVHACPTITKEEAQADGFGSIDEMETWLSRAHRGSKRHIADTMNRLMLEWQRP